VLSLQRILVCAAVSHLCGIWTDNFAMHLAWSFPVVAFVAFSVGCTNDLGAPPAENAPAARTQTFTDPNASVRDISAGDDDSTGQPGVDEPVEDQTPATEEPDAQPPASEDPDGDGAVLLSDEPAEAPADAQQSCTEWTDCGPHFADPNSGFDCVSGTCTCDDSGQWATACSDIGGSWSAWDCFCFVGTSPMPTAQAVPPQDAINGNGDDEDDVVCWWRWKDLGCDPDRWIDTSYYERVCDSHGCDDEYVDDGYYVDGECYGRWVKRCSNGYEYW
jgi:hypothetical protein